MVKETIRLPKVTVTTTITMAGAARRLPIEETMIETTTEVSTTANTVEVADAAKGRMGP